MKNEKSSNESNKDQVASIEKAINSKEAIIISMLSRSIEIFPYKVVYFDGALSVVGEDIYDNCLVALSFDRIESIKESFETFRPSFSQMEIGDFISAMRVVSGTEQRLVLKIASGYSMDFEPDFQYFSRPYITTNLNGETIWGASFEFSDEIFSWLKDHHKSVEILDPVHLKEDFKEYIKNEFFKKSA